MAKKMDAATLKNRLVKSKAVKKIDGELANTMLTLAELQAKRAQAVKALNDVESENLHGSDLLEARFHQKKRAIRECKDTLKTISEQHKGVKELMKQLRLELENIDIESAEEMLPLIQSSKVPVEERWKNAPIDHLMQYGLAQSVIDKLKTANVSTLGSLATAQSEVSFTFDDLGCTEGEGDKIDNSMTEFLAAYQSFTAEFQGKEPEEKAEAA